jgi:hypothetical protein
MEENIDFEKLEQIINTMLEALKESDTIIRFIAA